MHTAPASRGDQPRRHRPSRLTVFTTAFVAGAAVAFGVNRVLDVHIAQTRPQVECEPIFVALHSLPQGAPITVWDVALKDWPRAMLPTSALRARDTFEGMVLRHPLREGQPLLSVQLMPADGPNRSADMPAEQTFTIPLPAAPATQAAAAPEADLWAPAAPAAPEVAALAGPRASRTDVDVAPPIASRPTPAAEPAETFIAPQPAPVAETAVAVSPAPSADVEPTESDAAPAAEPTLAGPPDSVVDLEPELDAPELLSSNAPLYSPVPASPPADLDASLAGVGTLPAADVGSQADSGVSVLKPGSSESPAAQPQSPSQSAGRYLVVPERIALQADASFTPPAATQPTTTPPRPQAAPTATTTSKPAKRPTNTPGAAGQRPGTKRPQQPQPAPGAGRQAAATSRPLGGMFPNLAAGIDAISGGQRKPAAAAQPSSTTR